MMKAYRGVDKLNWFEVIKGSSSVKVREATLKQDRDFNSAVFALIVHLCLR